MIIGMYSTPLSVRDEQKLQKDLEKKLRNFSQSFIIITLVIYGCSKENFDTQVPHFAALCQLILVSINDTHHHEIQHNGHFATLSINGTQYMALNILGLFATLSMILSITVLSAIFLSVAIFIVMLSVIMLSVVMLSVANA